jgi:hypothetical protein
LDARAIMTLLISAPDAARARGGVPADHVVLATA